MKKNPTKQMFLDYMTILGICLLVVVGGIVVLGLILALSQIARSDNTTYQSAPPFGANLGLMPTNAPSVGDVLMVSASGQTYWVTLTNYVRTWSGTTGNTALGLGTVTYLPPNNTSATLLTTEAAGVTRTPLTRSTTLQNLYVVMTPAPGAGKTNIVSITTNGIASALTVNIIGTITNANDASHYIIVPAGTEIGVKITTAASSVAGKAAWSFEGR